uniref:ATP synthase F0 subunit 8 n=1 Tax=Pila globosa TaxID=759386 RepID=UPI0025A96798|nr:ATP synthase F0 subunit 8 [Pila globosa]WIW42427.1 ATP synthase F0 subunit 8 [Pila globosa]
MPQLSPLNWIFLFFMFWLLVIIISAMIWWNKKNFFYSALNEKLTNTPNKWSW